MTTLEQFISICYSLMIHQAPVPTQRPPLAPDVSDIGELKEAMESFNKLMSLSTPDMPTKDDLALD